MSIELLWIAVALSAGSIVKGATGMGLPMVALPILASFLGVPHAIAVMSLPILLSNAWQVWQHRHGIRGLGFLPWLLAMSVVGIAVGTYLLTALPAKTLSLVLAVMVLSYIGLRLARPDFALPLAVARAMAPAVGFGAGTLQGATGVSAPITITFVNALRMPRAEQVAALSCIFLLPTLFQFPALWFAGVLTPGRLVESALALIPVVVLMPVGARLGRRLSREWFDRIILGILGFIACELLVRGLGL
ncbi:MAG TPA: sulfite exporter TauE/SafE family protein [Hyphomicrobiales bacterium]|nr:sulfite exporter TauE/SafE family protein [Hyphomicrobiales bacterium]